MKKQFNRQKVMHESNPCRVGIAKFPRTYLIKSFCHSFKNIYTAEPKHLNTTTTYNKYGK